MVVGGTEEEGGQQGGTIGKKDRHIVGEEVIEWLKIIKKNKKKV